MVPPQVLAAKDVNLGDQHIHPDGSENPQPFGVPSLASGPVNLPHFDDI